MAELKGARGRVPPRPTAERSASANKDRASERSCGEHKENAGKVEAGGAERVVV